MRPLISIALSVPVAVCAIALASGPSDPPAPPGGAGETGSEQAPNHAPVIPPEVAARLAAAGAKGGAKPGDLPPFDRVGKDFKKVVSTADGSRPMYNLWRRDRDAQMLAELPSSFASQKLFIAYTVASGVTTAGVQGGDRYAYWKRFGNRLALIEPNYEVRSTGDLESKRGRDRVFTDRVIIDIPIVAKGPTGGLVIDLDDLLVGNASTFFGGRAFGANRRLATIAKAKAFPKNIEVAYTMPLSDGRFATLHYSLSALPARTGYKPRTADPRIGYFVTSFRDIGDPSKDTPWVRYITRWHVEKADPKLRLSPPKQPIIFYLENTVPVRYRRWVREGILEWNKAFEQIGIVGAVEVYQQDARTKAHMDKDPEDARYNFVLWTNSNMGFAIGPSRVDPRTGQILDADIVMDEGFVTSWVTSWQDLLPETAMSNFGPETLAWLATRPQWDPRVRLTSPTERPHVAQTLAMRQAQSFGSPYAGHPAASADPTLLGDDVYDGLAHRISQVNGRCECAQLAAQELALFRLDPTLLLDLQEAGDKEDDEEGDDEGDDDAKEDDADAEEDEDEEAEPKVDPGQLLDGVPEWFIGPLLKAVIMHEVGHTLGLRHNFKASTVYDLTEINSEAMKGQAITGSVMDYSPTNICYQSGETQGEYTMTTIGPYDYWAIEFGYTFDRDLKPILARVSEPDLIYGTDEDSFGSDPRAHTFDFGKNPLDYCDSQMALVQHLRGLIAERMVKDGESWDKARRGYEMLLNKHVSAVSAAANWIGGVYSNRQLKGDADAGSPVEPIDAEQQRRALEFVIEQTFRDEAFGLTPELLSVMNVEKWFDDFSTVFADPAWPVHDRVLGIQSAAMTMLLNPGTLNRVYDNEYRVPANEDALTIPELLERIYAETWTELDDKRSGTYTAREPMISSLRRNLQREHVERLIDLALPNPGLGAASKPVANLATMQLRELEERLDKALGKRRADPYTLAHLSEAQVRIDRALDAIYIYNTDDIGGGGGMSLPFFFGQPAETQQLER